MFHHEPTVFWFDSTFVLVYYLYTLLQFSFLSSFISSKWPFYYHAFYQDRLSFITLGSTTVTNFVLSSDFFKTQCIISSNLREQNGDNSPAFPLYKTERFSCVKWNKTKALSRSSYERERVNSIQKTRWSLRGRSG